MRTIRVTHVDSRWLFNQVQASGGKLLVDTRDRAEYEQDTIPFAISIPPPPSNATPYKSLDQVEDMLLPEHKHLFEPSKRKLREVILFGEVVNCHKATSPSLHDHQPCWLHTLAKLMIDDGLVASLRILDDGFVAFKTRFPFFTTMATFQALASSFSDAMPRTLSGTHSVNYPNEILEGFLFLGNMWHAQSREVIQHLGITHIVNASLDTGNLFEQDGVKYHEVKIKDRVESDITSHFDATFQFMLEASKSHPPGRVLVHCTQGISRSATIVVMYLMRVNNWSLVTAMNYTIASRGVVYPNEGFLNALLAEEYRLYHANSLVAEEFDTLLQQMIPDRPPPFNNRRLLSSGKCCECSKIFSLLDWKHKCRYCHQDFCSKCSMTRLAAPELEMTKHKYVPCSSTGTSGTCCDSSTNGVHALTCGASADDLYKQTRACDACVQKMWQINLPLVRKPLRRKLPDIKSIFVKCQKTFGKLVCINFFDGTDSSTLWDVIKKRFNVTNRQCIEISLETGEQVTCLNLAELPSQTVLYVSIGDAGIIGEQRKERSASGGMSYDSLHGICWSASTNGLTTSPNRTTKSTSTNYQRATTTQTSDCQSSTTSNSCSATSADKVDPHVSLRQLTHKAFPLLPGEVDVEAILSLADPAMTVDLMLAMSSLARKSMSLSEVQNQIGAMGYSAKDQQLMVSILQKACGNSSINAEIVDQ